MKYIKILFAFIIVSIALSCSNKLTVNLSDQHSKSKLSNVNREISKYQGDANAVELNAQLGDGLAVIENLELSEGELRLSF